MQSDELPDDGKDKLFVALSDILCANSQHLHIEFTSCIHSNLAVYTPLEDAIWVFLDTIPFHNSVINPVDDFAQDDAVFQVLV